MKKDLPAWAMRTAKPEDYELVQESQNRGTIRITWPDHKALRQWARLHGWPTPWFDFEKAYLAKMLENQESFAQAIDASGIEIRIPLREYTLSGATLQALDALYAERSPSGRPTSWGFLVEDLRELRRAVESGIVVQIEDGPRLETWQGFYDWAHGRYHMLEDGYDRWIGDDS